MLSFGMLLMPTMYRSHSNFQMSSGCAWGSMNIFMNQCWADMAARQNLYNVPIMNFGNFSPYGVPSSMNYLLDPGYAVAQWIGAGIASGQGGIQMPTLTNSDSNSSGLSDEEKKAKEQYNKLNLLLKTYCQNASRTGASIQSEMSEAIKGKTTWTEKLDALKEIYKKIDKNELKKTLATLESSNPKVNYRSALKNIGYDFNNDNSYSHNCNDKYIEDVKKLNNDDDIDNITKTLDKYAKSSDKDNHILNFISTWNDIDADTNLVDYAISKANPSEEGEEANTEVVTNLVNALVKKGNDIKSDPALSSTTKTELGSYIIDLKSELTNITSEDADTRNSSVNSFRQAFDDLYAALRIAETKIIQKQVKDDFGFTADIADDDTDFINETDLLVEETIEDLKTKEGLDETRLSDIKTNKIQLTA